MANLTLTRQWVENIYQLETSDPVMGGPDGIDNRQAKELGARTNWLKDQVDGLNQEKTGFALLDSPTFQGIPKANTAPLGTNTTQLATTAFVANAVANLVGSAPEALDTLEELARVLAGDANLKETLLNELAKKVSKDGDTMTGNLTIDHLFSILLGKRNGVLKYGVELRNAESDDLVLIKYNNGEISENATVIELMDNKVRANRPVYEGNSKLNSVAVIKGNIGNEATLPLPAGYTQAQCAWIVSINQDVGIERTRDAIAKYTRTECYVDGNRRVIARVFSENGFNTDSSGKKFDNSVANYLVIGVK